MNDSAGRYVGGPVPSGLIAAPATPTPATVFTLDAATFCSDAPREMIP